MTTLPPSDPSVQFTPLAREGAWREGRASLKPAGKAAQLSWRSVMALMLLALATAHIPQPAAAQTCTAPPNCAAYGQALTWNGTAWQCIAPQANCRIDSCIIPNSWGAYWCFWLGQGRSFTGGWDTGIYNDYTHWICSKVVCDGGPVQDHMPWCV